MADDFQYDVFLSHSSKDKAVVRPIAERLRDYGLRVWFDEWKIEAGDSIPRKIEEGLETSRVLVFCMSANAFGSDWAQLESNTFRFRDPQNKERRLIPLRLDETPISSPLEQFRYIQWSPQNPEPMYQALLEALRGRDQGPPVLKPPMSLNGQRTLVVGELMIDITEHVKEPEVRRTAARHKFPVYQNAARPRHVLGGVFFHARFLEPISKSLQVVFPFPTMATPSMDIEDEISELRESREKWHIYGAQVSRQPYSVRRTFLEPTQEEVLRVDSGIPEQLNDAELGIVEEQMSLALKDCLARDEESAVLLADYDLGLFSNDFIAHMPRLLQDIGADEIPVVVHSGRSWLKFARLPHAIIVSDLSEALVDFLRMDPEQHEASLMKEFDRNPFPRIAKTFPDLGGLVLTAHNEIRAGFWSKDRGFLTGEEIVVTFESGRSQPKVGGRAIVACWLCASLRTGQSRRTRILQAVEALNESSAILTDSLWRDEHTPERLGRLLKSNTIQARVRVTQFSEPLITRPPSPAPPHTAVDTFPGPRLRIVCLYHAADAPHYADFEAAVALQRRTGELSMRAEAVTPGDFQVERIRGSLKVSEAVILFGTSKFYTSPLYQPLVQVLQDLQKSKGTRVFLLPFDNPPAHADMLSSLEWLEHARTITNGVSQPWKEVIDCVGKAVSTTTPRTQPGSLEEQTLAVYRNRRIEITASLADYYAKRFADLSGFFRETGIPVLMKPDWLPGEPFPVEELDGRVKFVSCEEDFRDMRSEFLDLLRAHDRAKKLFDGVTYRLVKIEGTAFTFCRGRYFDFIKTCESLGYEAAREWLRASEMTRSDWAGIRLRSREETQPTDFASRSTAFGTCTLVLVGRKSRPPVFLLNQRSNALAETPGLKHVIPAGTFQPHGYSDVQLEKQLSFSLNIFRELIEELVSDEGARYQRQSEIGFPDSLTPKGKAFFENTYSRGAYELFHLGTVIDPFNLKPEILTVCILSEETAGLLDALHPSWETDQSVAREVFTEKRLQELLSAYNFVPTGRAHLHLVKRHFDFLNSRLMS